MEPADIVPMVYAALDEHGLDDWSFQWDRAKSRAGCCHYRQKLITLSYEYVVRNITNLDDIKDTILHEIAHALAGHKAGHGSDWKAVCCRIGANPVRCYGTHVSTPARQYVATCPTCGKQFKRHRAVNRGTYKYCLKCGPDNGRLTYIKS